MKNSGIEWIGEIPDSWSCLKAKYGIQSNDGGVWGNDLVGDENDKVVFRSTEQTIDGKWSIDNPAKRNFTFDISYYKILPGDLLITKSSGSLLHIGKTTLADSFFETNECYYSNFLQRIRLKAVFLPKYSWYLFNSILVREQFIYIQNSTSGLGNITASNIENIFVPLPLLKQQQQIVCFLDSRMEKIDALIEIQQAQIEKLKEYKQSVITEAVTKGIDPNVPMKDSGVEWIGKVPSNYLMKKMGWLADYKKGPFGSSIKISMFVPKGENTYKVYEQKNAIYKDEKLGSYYISKEKFEELSSNEVLPGDIIVSCAGTIGECYQMPENMEPGIINQALMRVRLNGEIISEYFLYLFDAVISKASQSASNGSAMKNIPPFDVLKNIRVFIPSIDLQRKIVDFLNKKCRNIQCLLSLKQTKIEKLQEYKKSLIYEYVTGKREVL